MPAIVRNIAAAPRVLRDDLARRTLSSAFSYGSLLLAIAVGGLVLAA